MIPTVNIPGLFKTVVERMNQKTFLQRQDDPFEVFFSHGVYDSVKKELISKGESISLKDKKYPLIWLVTPLNQVPYPKGTDAYCELSDLMVFILTSANPDHSEDQNIQNCFVPRLRPVYEEFLTQIERSCLFQVLSPEAIPHEVKEWTCQSTTDGKAHLFSDHINCIQIKRLRLLVNEPVGNNPIFNPY